MLLFGISVTNPTNQANQPGWQIAAELILPLFGAAILTAIIVRLPGISNLRNRLIPWDQVINATITSDSSFCYLSFIFRGAVNKDTLRVVPQQVKFTMPLGSERNVEQFLWLKLGAERVRRITGEPAVAAGKAASMFAPSSPSGMSSEQTSSGDAEWIQRLGGVKEGNTVGDFYLTKDRLAFVKTHQILGLRTLKTLSEPSNSSG